MPQYAQVLSTLREQLAAGGRISGRVGNLQLDGVLVEGLRAAVEDCQGAEIRTVNGRFMVQSAGLLVRVRGACVAGDWALVSQRHCWRLLCSCFVVRLACMMAVIHISSIFSVCVCDIQIESCVAEIKQARDEDWLSREMSEELRLVELEVRWI